VGKSKRFWYILIGIAGGAGLLMCVAFLAVSGKGSLAFNRVSSGITVGIGHEAPEFQLSTLSGDVIRLSQYHGQPTLIYFGTSW
jgi:cytochrome oxidase Cu insertion factor (SCO1/SenC/PrrC family)